MVDGIVEVISKPEFLEVSHTDFFNHISLINNIVSEDKPEILAEFDNSSGTEANDSEIERLVNEKSDETITAKTEKKITSLSRNMRNKACQVNFDEVNNKVKIVIGVVARLYKIRKWPTKLNFEGNK